MLQQSKQRITKPTVLRIYHRLLRHLEYVKDHQCDHCYVKGNSLIIQGDATEHIKAIADIDFNHVDLDNIVDDLQDFNLALCINVRDGLNELALLQKGQGKPR